MLHIYNGILLSHKKKNEILPFAATGMDLWDYHYKWSKSGRERQISYNVYMWNLEKWYRWSYLQSINRDTDVENKCTDTKAGRGGGGMDWKFGISRCKLLYREWINNKVLLYSTGDYIQYPVINHNGKEYEKEYIYKTE